MPLARVLSRALVGIDSPLVEVEVHLANGLPAFHIVGLPEAAVRESRERVRAALLHGGYDFPNRRLTVNLAPADLPKDSGRFDLPIAIGVLVASGQIPAERTAGRVFVGELSLSGELRPIRGALAMALAMAREASHGDRKTAPPDLASNVSGNADRISACAEADRDADANTDEAADADADADVRACASVGADIDAGADAGDPARTRLGDPTHLAVGAAQALVLPAGNTPEVALVPGLTSAPAATFEQVCQDLRGDLRLAQTDGRHAPGGDEIMLPLIDDMADVRGQPFARRALEIAAAGGHSLLLVGPPGSGKSMLAQRLPGILPPLSDGEALETGAIASLAGHFDPRCWRLRPFRAPHHTASTVALIGGGSRPRPGEISLAHHGVLFLDELPEFGSRTLESLREPLETGLVHIARANHRLSLPASFQLVAAMNPCPCGYLGEPRCRCTPPVIARYQRRLSGPLLDRLDMHLWIAPVSADALVAATPGETSTAVAARVAAARDMQMARQGCINGKLPAARIDTACTLEPGARELLIRTASRMQWSGRVLHRVIRVARSVADLAGAADIDPAAVAEAIGLRRALFEQRHEA
ncbi:MAG: YifB family Mg chelatase-like AAA ATPase [Burkholderiaceae bacterium]